MKKKLLLFFLSILMVSCTNDFNQEDTICVQAPVVESLDSEQVPSKETIESMFGKYSTKTRAIGIIDNNENYDFQKVEVKKTQDKDALIYEVPSKSTSSLEDIMVGVGDDNNIEVKMYFKETSQHHYTLYNQDYEPIYDVEYYESTNTICINKTYGNDVTVLPSTRALSKKTWSYLCNGAVAAGGLAASLVGAVPTAGATIGLAVCSYVIASALC